MSGNGTNGQGGSGRGMKAPVISVGFIGNPNCGKTTLFRSEERRVGKECRL